MKKIMQTTMLCTTLLLTGVFVSSCSDMNELHDKYLKQGETIYIGQLDKIALYPGDGRAKLEYWSSDPKAEKLKIYWNFRADSVVLDIPANTSGQPVEVILDNMEEKRHLLEFVTMDREMIYNSVPMNGSVTVYGPKFKSTLFDRNMRYVERKGPNSVTITWQGPVENGLESEVEYIDKSGNKKTLSVPMSEKKTQLDDFKSGLRFRTRVLPDPLSIDILSTAFTDQQQIDKELDRTLYKRWNPTGIPYNDLNATYSIEKAFDQNTNTFFIFKAPSPGIPYSFTFDLGQETVISRFRQWQRLTAGVIYQIQNIKRFELWGSLSPEVNENFETWTKIGTFESKKPSGLPSGQISPEDLEYATVGEDYLLTQKPGKFRYIRYHVLELWGGNATDVALGDITFFEAEE